MLAMLAQVCVSLPIRADWVHRGQQLHWLCSSKISFDPIAITTSKLTPLMTVVSEEHSKRAVRTVTSKENGATLQIYECMLYIMVQLSCKGSSHSIWEMMQRSFTMPAILAKFLSLALLNFWHD